MPIFIGGTQINDIRIGSTEINSVWVGGTQVWVRSLVDPESGWNSTSGNSTSEQGANLTSGVTMTQNATLKVTISGSSSGQFNFAAMDVKTSSSSNWPGSGTSPHKWGYQGSSFGTQKTINVYAGNVIRFYGWIAQSGTGIDVSVTVLDGSDNSTVDTFDIDHFDQPQSPYGCFLENSMVMLEDLTSKRIADMQPGDMVIGDNGIVNQVIELRVRDQAERVMFNINDLQTTESHPIKTSEGWKAISPEAAMAIHPDMTITQLNVGDSLTRVNAQGVEYADEITSITAVIMNVQVYNLNVSGNDTPDITGNDTYVVDNVLVHNK
mgnify:FL=1|jgi:hypothetical protein